MWLVLDGHSFPGMAGYVDVGCVDVLVLSDEVFAQNGAEQFRRVDGVMFGNDVACVLDCIGSDKDAVVFFGVTYRLIVSRNIRYIVIVAKEPLLRSFYVSFQQDADCQFVYCLHPRSCITVDFI